ncbi:hypothetical protein MTO96_045366 [Rhipicephalus appendiculatus]
MAKATIHATGRASACKGEDLIVRLKRGWNAIIVCTPHEATAATFVKITSLTFQERPHPVKVYLSTPKYVPKGIVHGIDAGASEEELLANLRVRTHGVRIVRARMLGQSQTALPHFECPPTASIGVLLWRGDALLMVPADKAVLPHLPNPRTQTGRLPQPKGSSMRRLQPSKPRSRSHLCSEVRPVRRAPSHSRNGM